jgi:ribosomal protein S18 acetylase RimI-like enzyme
MEFQSAQHTDLKRIAKCHYKVFPRSLTTRMGVPYLEKIFSWYLSTDKAFLFFVEAEGKVAGYAGGMIVDGTLAHGSASSLTQHTFNDSIKALLARPWLFFHPEFVSRYALFTRNIFTRIRNKFQSIEVRSAVKPVEPYAGLVVIGVDPAFQGKGYGSAILTEFEKRTIHYGLKRMLLTVNVNNEKAIKSYTRNGWHTISTKHKSVSMEKRLN